MLWHSDAILTEFLISRLCLDLFIYFCLKWVIWLLFLIMGSCKIDGFIFYRKILTTFMGLLNLFGCAERHRVDLSSSLLLYTALQGAWDQIDKLKRFVCSSFSMNLVVLSKQIRMTSITSKACITWIFLGWTICLSSVYDDNCSLFWWHKSQIWEVLLK